MPLTPIGQPLPAEARRKLVVFAAIFGFAPLFVLIAGAGFLLTGDTHAAIVLIGVVAAGWVVVGGSSVLGHKLGRY